MTAFDVVEAAQQNDNVTLIPSPQHQQNNPSQTNKQTKSDSPVVTALLAAW